jgi:hypothetical protein
VRQSGSGSDSGRRIPTEEEGDEVETRLRPAERRGERVEGAVDFVDLGCNRKLGRRLFSLLGFGSSRVGDQLEHWGWGLSAGGGRGVD